MKKITREWLKAANDDLETIKELTGLEHLTHVSAFHVQQCVEKCFKSVIEEYSLTFEKIHNLEKLLDIIDKYINFDIDFDILQTLDKLYIDTRYPGDLGLLPQGKPSLQDAQEFNQFAKDIYKQVEQTLEQTPNKESESQ